MLKRCRLFSGIVSPCCLFIFGTFWFLVGVCLDVFGVVLQVFQYLLLLLLTCHHNGYIYIYSFCCVFSFNLLIVCVFSFEFPSVLLIMFSKDHMHTAVKMPFYS